MKVNKVGTRIIFVWGPAFFFFTGAAYGEVLVLGKGIGNTNHEGFEKLPDLQSN